MLNSKSGINALALGKLERQYFGASFLVLAILAIIVSTQKYVKHASTTEYYSIPLSLLYNFIVFSTYALFAPIIIKVVNRFPLRKKFKVTNFMLHLGLSVVLGLVHMLLCNLILYGIDLSTSPIFPRFIAKYLTGVIHIHLLAYWVILGFISFRKKDQAENNNGKLDQFVIKENKYTSFLALEKVHWIEAIDHYQKLHTGDGFYIYKDSMSNLVRRLPPDKFKRIHRSFIVNLGQIEGLKKTDKQLLVRLQCGQELLVGKSFRTEMRSLFS